MTRKATSQDVAALAGVSRSAVSLVLNGRGAGNISPHKQQAILDAAAQLDYRPNAVALSLRSRRSWTIGVLTWGGPSGFPEEMLNSTLRTAGDAGYLMLAMDIADNHELEQRAAANLVDRQVDGFAVIAPELVDYQPPAGLGQLPTVLMNCVDPAGELLSVAPDEFAAGHFATQILIDRGHQTIAVLADGAPQRQASDRRAGALSALADAALSAELVRTVERDAQSAYAATRRLFAEGYDPTGIVCSHERHAIGVLAAAAELGLRVPADLSVTSMDDGESLACDLVPRVATLQRPDRALAAQATTMLIRSLSGAEQAGPRQVRLACQAALRESVAPPRATAFRESRGA